MWRSVRDAHPRALMVIGVTVAATAVLLLVLGVLHVVAPGARAFFASGCIFIFYFVPMAFASRVPLTAIVVLVAGAGLLPVWGWLFKSALSDVVIPVVVASLAPALVAITFRRSVTAIVGLVGCFAAGAVMVRAMNVTSSGGVSWSVAAAIVVWHAFMCAQCAWGAAWRLFPEQDERSRNRCLRCGYDIRGLPTDVCPECGTWNPRYVQPSR